MPRSADFNPNFIFDEDKCLHTYICYVCMYICIHHSMLHLLQKSLGDNFSAFPLVRMRKVKKKLIFFNQQVTNTIHRCRSAVVNATISKSCHAVSIVTFVVLLLHFGAEQVCRPTSFSFVAGVRDQFTAHSLAHAHPSRAVTAHCQGRENETPM